MLQQHRVKLETKPKKFEDRVLVRTLGWGRGGGIKSTWAGEGKEPGGTGETEVGGELRTHSLGAVGGWTAWMSRSLGWGM